MEYFKGAILVISHDRYLLRACVDQFIWVHDGSASPFDGDLDDYKKQLQQLKPLPQKLRTAEQQLDKLSDKEAKLSAELADSAIYDDVNKDKLQQLLSEEIETVIQAFEV